MLPTAAIEQHGHHLPLATDTLINNLLLGHALGKLPAEMPVYALPPVHYGKSNEHIGFPGTLSVSAATFMAVLRDLGASLSKAGFQKLVLYNTHGGNTRLIDVMARDLRAEFGLRTFALHGSGGISFEGLDPQERAYGFHAGEVETSFLLASMPELVDRSAYTSNYIADISKPEMLLPENAPATFAWLTRDIAASGVMGDPRPATRGKRRALAGTGGHAPGRCACKRCRTIRNAARHERIRLGRLRQRRAPGTRRALPHARRRGTGFRSLLSADSPGPHPTLLMRQPYGREIASTVVYAHPVWFARHGYNVVIQDVRGRGDSEGEFYPFRNEGRDGADTIAWLRTRRESNGRIGMYGFSYQGMTQLLAAAEQPEGLLCIAPGMTACDLYHGWFYQQGALRLASTLGWGLQMLKEDARRKKLREASDRLETSLGAISRRKPACCRFARIPRCTAKGCRTTCWTGWITMRPANIGPRSTSASASSTFVFRPCIFPAGMTCFCEGSVDGFLALCESAGSEFAREHQYLLAGPWVHIPWGDRIGAADFGPEALVDTDAILLRWFDHWLKDSGAFAGAAQCAISCSEKIAGAKRTLFPRRRTMPSISTATAGRIREREMGLSPR